MSPIHASRSLWTSAAAGYTGPGDVVAGAAAWWGLRAYSNASIGSNAVRLREDNGNTELDFVTVTGGGVDVAAIAAWKTLHGATNLFVVKVYDQTGNGFDQVQATAGNQPLFTLSGLGSLPIIGFDGSRKMETAGSDTYSPNLFTVSSVANHTSGGTQQTLLTFAGLNALVGYNNSGANTVFQFASNVNSATASDGVWHALQGVFTATGDMNVDGSSSLGAVGASGSASTYQFGQAGGSQLLIGSVVELGAWKSLFSSGDRISMSANQHAYWGF